MERRKSNVSGRRQLPTVFFRFSELRRPDSMARNSRSLSQVRISSSLGRVAGAMRKAPLLILALAAGSGIVLADTDLAWMAGFAAGTGFLGALWMRKRNRALAILIAGTVTALLLFEWRQETRLSHIHGFPLASELARGDELRLRGEGWISGPVEMGSRSSRSTSGCPPPTPRHPRP